MTGIKIAHDAAICITHKGEDIYLPAAVVLSAADFLGASILYQKIKTLPPITRCIRLGNPSRTHEE